MAYPKNMCGRFNIIDDPLTKMLSEQLGLFEQHHNLRFSDDIAPASTISIITQHNQQRFISDATWWLLLSANDNGFKANYQYASFNSRCDKLNQPNAMAYQPFRQSRCIIPASSFVEGQDKRYHQLALQDSAIAFGGLYKSWQHQHTGEVVQSASIITLGGHPKLEHIHRKSTPLMLPLDNRPLIDAWLDNDFSHVSSFEPFLIPKITRTIIATPIDKPSKRLPIGLSEQISVDSAKH